MEQGNETRTSTIGPEKFEVAAWDLKDLEVQDFDSLLSQLDQLTSELEAGRPLLTESVTSSQFNGLLDRYSDLRALSSRLGSFCSLRRSEDSTNQEYQADFAKVISALTKTGNRLLFFSLWFKELNDDKAEALIAGSGKYSYFLSDLRRTRRFTLKEEQEKLINIKDVNGVSALNRIYDTLASQFEYEFGGEKISQSQLLTYVRNEKAVVREDAYRTLFSKYVHYKDVFGEIYRCVVNDWREENVALRGYSSPIQVRNIQNDIPDEAVETLLDVCEKNQSLFHRFFQVKKQRLGLDVFRRFDLYAPVETRDEDIDYDAALRMVLDAFHAFSPEFARATSTLVERNHLHTRLQKNKRGGAFCAYTGAKRLPYVLMNYAGKSRDVSTLAHELGHAIHGMLASNESEMTYIASLPMAETASIFAEMLLSEKLIERFPEKASEVAFQKLEDLYATVIRQTGFVRFEKKAHAMLEQGATIADLGKVYLEDLRVQLGTGVDVDEIFQYEWSYIPHIFHTPFYCYAYAFGNLLTLGLYQLYKENGPSFAPKIIRMLARGGSASPRELTSELGIDICSEHFWSKCFVQVDDLVKKLEA